MHAVFMQNCQNVTFIALPHMHTLFDLLVTSDPATMSILHKEIAAVFEHSLLIPSAPPKSLLFTPLLNELLSSEVATIWDEIGVVLGVDDNFLETTKINHPNDCKVCFFEVLKEWMKQINPPPSWLTIISAIEKFQNFRSLAQTLKRKYLPEGDHQGAKAMNSFALGGSSAAHVHGQGLSDMPGLNRGKFIHASELPVNDSKA